MIGILSQDFNGRVAGAGCRIKFKRFELRSVAFTLYVFTFALCLSCGSQPTDLRLLVPADTIVYLETNDLAAALQPIIDSKPFAQAARSKPDFSALNGVQLAVAVTGFNTTEEKLTDEYSVGRIQPNFVAIADTHAWNWQAVAFAEQKLGSFVANIYHSEPTAEKYDKNGGKYFTWTAEDGRKAHAFVSGSLIFFGNDEKAIEKCLAVKRGEAESIAKTVRPYDPATLASGYVSTDGVAQMAALAGLSIASLTSDNEEVQKAVAVILPQLIRGTVKDISWAATRHAQGYEDRFTFGGTNETSMILSETFASTARIDAEMFQFVPNTAVSVTLYNLDKPNIAWRSLLLTSQTKVDSFGAMMIGEFSNAFAEPYGVIDAELFLSGVGSNIVTLRTDPEGDMPALIALITNDEAVRRSLAPDLKPDNSISSSIGFEVLRDGDTMTVFAGKFVITGDSEAVTAAILSRSARTNLSSATVELFRPGNSASSLSFASGQAALIADLFSEKRTDEPMIQTFAITETRFSRTGIERRTVSEFGFVGWLATQLTAE